MEPEMGIVVMAKLPCAGEAKTRLSGVLNPERRAALQAALLRDTVAKARLVGKTYLAFTPADAEAEALTYGADEAFAQVGADIGERMANAVERVTACGHTRAIVIGTDCPYLTARDLREAAECLREADVCLGPALDGGYYLIGLRRPHRGVFADVPWSTPLTYAATVQRIEELELTYRLIRPLSDVDTAADLAMLMRSTASREPWVLSAPSVCALLSSWSLELTVDAP
jgi:rSAM/selenodomain-associated transferase 1